MNDPPPGTDEIIAMTKIVTFLEEGYLLPNGQTMVSTYIQSTGFQRMGAQRLLGLCCCCCSVNLIACTWCIAESGEGVETVEYSTVQ